LDMVADTALMGEMDALTIRNNAEREAYNYQVAAYNTRAQAGNFRAESGLLTMAGRNAAANGAWGAGTTLLGGAAQAGMNYNAAKGYSSSGWGSTGLGPNGSSTGKF
jgi:hypothetical protein